MNNAPLALELHYLLMAYGRDDYQAEILMGYAMQLLHDTPVLTRKSIQDSLSAIPSWKVTGILPAGLPGSGGSGPCRTDRAGEGSPPALLGVEDLQAMDGVSGQSLPTDGRVHRLVVLIQEEIHARRCPC